MGLHTFSMLAMIMFVCLISIEKNEANNMDIDEIINKFTDAHKNRRFILM